MCNELDFSNDRKTGHRAALCFYADGQTLSNQEDGSMSGVRSARGNSRRYESRRFVEAKEKAFFDQELQLMAEDKRMYAELRKIV